MAHSSLSQNFVLGKRRRCDTKRNTVTLRNYVDNHMMQEGTNIDRQGSIAEQVPESFAEKNDGFDIEVFAHRFIKHQLGLGLDVIAGNSIPI